MYIISNQTTIECYLSISICFMLLPCQLVTSQPSISCVFILNYKFSFNIPICFCAPFIPFPFLFPTILDPILFLVIKCRNGDGREGFSTRFRLFSSLLRFEFGCKNFSSDATITCVEFYILKSRTKKSKVSHFLRLEEDIIDRGCFEDRH